MMEIGTYFANAFKNVLTRYLYGFLPTCFLVYFAVCKGPILPPDQSNMDYLYKDIYSIDTGEHTGINIY